MLTDLAGFADKYKTRHAEEWDADIADREWLTEIPCGGSRSKDHIYTVSKTMLGYFCFGRAGLRQRLLSIPGVVMGQDSDREFAVHFPVETLGAVAKIVRAAKRIRLSDAEKQRRADSLKQFRFARKNCSYETKDGRSEPGWGVDNPRALKTVS